MKKMLFVLMGSLIIAGAPLKTYAQTAAPQVLSQTPPRIAAVQEQIKEGLDKINKLREEMKIEVAKLKDLGKQFKDQVVINKGLYAQLRALSQPPQKNINTNPTTNAVPVAPVKN